MLESARAERQCECERSITPIRIFISDRIVPGCEARLNRAESAEILIFGLFQLRASEATRASMFQTGAAEPNLDRHIRISPKEIYDSLLSACNMTASVPLSCFPHELLSLHVIVITSHVQIFSIFKLYSSAQADE